MPIDLSYTLVVYPYLISWFFGMGASMAVCIPDFEQNFLFFLQCSFFCTKTDICTHTWVETNTKKTGDEGNQRNKKTGHEDNDNLELIPT